RTGTSQCVFVALVGELGWAKRGGREAVAPPPHQLDDTGDREVEQAEAAISKEGLPELGDGAPREADAEVPPLPDAEVPSLPKEDRPGELPPPKPGPGTTEAA